MNAGIKKHLKQMQRIQKIYENNYNALSSYTYLSESTRWFLHHQERVQSIGLQNIQEMMTALYKSTQLINNYLAINEHVKNFTHTSILESLNYQRELIKYLNHNSANNFGKISEWHASITNIIEFQSPFLSIEIDKSMYQSFDEMVSQFESSPYYNSDINDIPVEITVKNREVPTPESKITLSGVISWIFITLQIIIQFHMSNVSNIQHKEIMTELEQQTEIYKENLNINKQRLDLEKKTIRT